MRAFQVKYADDVLIPWGLGADEPTGYVYYTTRKKINEIFCGRSFPLSNEQLLEIEQCRLNMLSGQGGGSVFVDSTESTRGRIGIATSTALALSLSDTEDSVAEDSTGTQADSFVEKTQDRLQKIAAAAFTLPQDTREAVFYGLWFVLILALVYILGSLAAGMRDSGGMTQNQIRVRKILYFMVGSLIGLIVSVAIDLPFLVIPLIIVIVALSIALFYYISRTAY